MRQIVKILFISAIIVIQPLLSSSVEGIKEERYTYFLEGKELKALVTIKGGVYINDGHPVGFHFDLLNRFANHQRCNIIINPVHNRDHWRELAEGKVDLLVVDAARDSIPFEFADRVISGVDLNDSEQVWVVRKENYQMLQNMNYWFGYFSHTKEYSQLVSSYYRRYSRNRFPSGPVSVLSPYDSLIRSYSAQIGWDWRLLASLIYQESKFSISAKSGRGAHGLMQIMSSTARQFNIENLYDPEQNIKAGTMLLKRLSGLYTSPQIDSVNKIKFILAAYNAGEGRVEDVRRVAEYKGFDPHNWDSAKDAILYMRSGDKLPEGVVKFGRFKGVETLNFVDEVLTRYENYKVMVK